MKILNLYGGIGGNRKLWGDEHEVTAVENNPEIAKIYIDNFPNDKIHIGDAHQYLLKHFREFDFIWSSPPCQSHSFLSYLAMKHRVKNGKIQRTKDLCYPEMSLWQEIIFLEHFFKGKWVVENVNAYYERFGKPQKCGRHIFWANFIIPNIKKKLPGNIARLSNKEIEKRIGFDLRKYKIVTRKDQIVRNCVLPELGLHIFNCAFKTIQKTIRGVRKDSKNLNVLKKPSDG